MLEIDDEISWLIPDRDTAAVYREEICRKKVRHHHITPAERLCTGYLDVRHSEPVILLKKWRRYTDEGSRRRREKLPPFESGKKPAVRQFLTPEMRGKIRDAIAAGKSNTIDARLLADYFDRCAVPAESRLDEVDQDLFPPLRVRVPRSVAVAKLDKVATSLLAATKRKYPEIPIEGQQA